MVTVATGSESQFWQIAVIRVRRAREGAVTSWWHVIMHWWHVVTHYSWPSGNASINCVQHPSHCNVCGRAILITP